MRLGRHPRTPRGLRRVEVALRKIHKRKDHAIDLHVARRHMSRFLGRLVVTEPDDAVQEAVDSYVQTFVSDLRAAARHQHEVDLRALDLLEARVRGYVVRLTGLHENETRALRHLDAAVAHALDRLGQPDTPFYNPLLPEPGRE